MHEIVEDSFSSLEKDLTEKLEAMHQEKEIYSLEKSKKMDKQVGTNLEQLYSLLEGLRGERGLSNMIYFLREKRADIENFHSTMSSYLNVHTDLLRPMRIISPNSKSIVSLSTALMHLSRESSKSYPSTGRIFSKILMLIKNRE